MAAEFGPSFGQECELHPQAPGSVPRPESLQAEQFLDEELVTGFSQLGLQFDGEIDGEIDEAAFSELVGRIQDFLKQKVSEGNYTAMIRTFLSWPSRTESRRGKAPSTLEELFEAVAQRHRHMQIVYLQGLLYTSGRQGLCKDVESMVEETTAAGTMRIPYISYGPPQSSYPDLQDNEGVFQIYMESTFEDIDLKLQNLRKELSTLLGLHECMVKVRSITCGSGFWITILVPLPAMEKLRQKFYEADIENYLASIGIMKIKFLQPQKTDEGKKGKGKKRERTPEPKAVKMEPTPGTSRGAKYKRTRTEPEAGIETGEERSLSVGGKEIPEWINWSKADLVRYFKEKEHHGVAEILGKMDCKGRDMGLWNASALEDMGMSDEQVRAVITEMEKLDVYGQIRVKVVNDPIHGHIEIHPLCIKIIDTPEFQRLRNIKQLGSVCLIYPGANHSRFEHSLGVCHLAGQLVSALQERQPSLDITDVDKLCVTIAGLCHDLGHGPYSHHFEQFMKEAKPGTEWQHEDCSIMMFDHMITKNNLESDFLKYGLREIDLTFIREQIQGVRGDKEAYVGRREEKRFLYEIVANKRNGIDVDKWDYLSRDSLLLGLRNNFDHHRFIRHARVIKMKNDWRICSRDKEAEDLYKMFQTRYVLSRIAYQHKVHQAIEAMMVDALLCADKSGAITYRGQDGKRLHISECVTDPVAFTNLDDSVFSRIQLSEVPELQPARDILSDIRCRRLYRLVRETEPSAKKMDQKVLEELVTAPLRKDRYVVKEMILDYGMKEKNPIEEMLFYRKDDPNSAVKISKAQVSLFLPEKFLEQIVRLYSKDRDQQSFDMAARQFDKWCDRHALHIRAGWHS